MDPVEITSQSQKTNASGIGIFLKVLIILFWLGQIWTTPYYKRNDFLDYGYNGIVMYIDSVLQENTLVGGRFSVFEVILFVLGSYLFYRYRGTGIEEKESRWFLLISFLAVFISFLNPNNSFDQFKYLFANDPRLLLFYFFLLFTFLSISKEHLWIILYNFVKYGFIIALTQGAISSALFIMGKGIYFIGSSTTLPNAEILNVLIILSTIALSLFAKTRRPAFLLFVLLIHFTVLFGDRRTPIIVMILSDLLIFIYYNKISVPAILKLLAIFVIIYAAYYLLLSYEKFDLGYHLARVYSIFTSSYQGKYIDDMGHLEQTQATFATLLNNLDKFWGAGMRNYYDYVEGQSVYIHNNFVVVWALYGLHMSLFLLYVLYTYLKHTVKMFKESFVLHNHPVKAAVVFSSMMLLIGDAFTGDYFCKHFCYLSLFVFSITFLRLTTEDEKKLLFMFSGKRIMNSTESYSLNGSSINR
jgi:hypothetical protein